MEIRRGRQQYVRYSSDICTLLLVRDLPVPCYRIVSNLTGSSFITLFERRGPNADLCQPTAFVHVLFVSCQCKTGRKFSANAPTLAVLTVASDFISFGFQKPKRTTIYQRSKGVEKRSGRKTNLGLMRCNMQLTFI